MEMVNAVMPVVRIFLPLISSCQQKPVSRYVDIRPLTTFLNEYGVNSASFVDQSWLLVENIISHYDTLVSGHSSTFF
jgi:hypothetical protein